jgi:anti-sigma factor RsiW
MTTTEHILSPEEIMAWLDHQLPPSQSALVADHLATCAECDALADELRGISTTLSSWTVPPIPLHVQQKVLETSRSTAPRKARHLWLVWLVAAPAVAALLIMAFIMTTSQHHPLMKRAALASPPPMAYVSPLSAPPTLEARKSRVTFDGADAMAAPTAASIMAPPMIAHTAALTVQVRSVTAARSTLDQILSRHQGYFAEMSVSGADSSSPILTSSLRIPADELPLTMNELKNLGKVLSETQAGEEVGKQHADLVARLKTSRETEERYRSILQQRTGSVADILEVEQAIARTRGEIESMEAQQQSLEHRVNFASVQLNLNEPYNPALESSTDSIGLHNRNSIVAGWHNAIGTILGILYFLEEYGPVLLIWIALLGLPTYFLYRRYRRKGAQL